MSIKLAHNNAPAYDYLSEGDGTDPAVRTAVLDNAGGTITTDALTLYLIATGYAYTGISVTPVTEEAGVNWQVSLDGAVWDETVTPADMDASAVDVVTPIYARAVVANDGSVGTGAKTAADLRVIYTES